MNKEQEELLNEVYRKYADSHEYFVDGWVHVIPMEHSKETFVNECKTNTEFSEKWGLKIDERELSLEERATIWNNTHNPAGNIFTHNQYDENNIPKRAISLRYNHKTITSYE